MKPNRTSTNGILSKVRSGKVLTNNAFTPKSSSLSTNLGLHPQKTQISIRTNERNTVRVEQTRQMSILGFPEVEKAMKNIEKDYGQKKKKMSRESLKSLPPKSEFLMHVSGSRDAIVQGELLTSRIRIALGLDYDGSRDSMWNTGGKATGYTWLQIKSGAHVAFNADHQEHLLDIRKEMGNIPRLATSDEMMNMWEKFSQFDWNDADLQLSHLPKIPAVIAAFYHFYEAPAIVRRHVPSGILRILRDCMVTVCDFETILENDNKFRPAMLLKELDNLCRLQNRFHSEALSVPLPCRTLPPADGSQLPSRVRIPLGMDTFHSEILFEQNDDGSMIVDYDFQEVKVGETPLPPITRYPNPPGLSNVKNTVYNCGVTLPVEVREKLWDNFFEWKTKLSDSLSNIREKHIFRKNSRQDIIHPEDKIVTDHGELPSVEFEKKYRDLPRKEVLDEQGNIKVVITLNGIDYDLYANKLQYTPLRPPSVEPRAPLYTNANRTQFQLASYKPLLQTLSSSVLLLQKSTSKYINSSSLYSLKIVEDLYSMHLRHAMMSRDIEASLGLLQAASMVKVSHVIDYDWIALASHSRPAIAANMRDKDHFSITNNKLANKLSNTTMLARRETSFNTDLMRYSREQTCMIDLPPSFTVNDLNNCTNEQLMKLQHFVSDATSSNIPTYLDGSHYYSSLLRGDLDSSIHPFSYRSANMFSRHTNPVQRSVCEETLSLLPLPLCEIDSNYHTLQYQRALTMHKHIVGTPVLSHLSHSTFSRPGRMQQDWVVDEAYCDNIADYSHPVLGPAFIMFLQQFIVATTGLESKFRSYLPQHTLYNTNTHKNAPIHPISMVFSDPNEYMGAMGLFLDNSNSANRWNDKSQNYYTTPEFWEVSPIADGFYHNAMEYLLFQYSSLPSEQTRPFSMPITRTQDPLHPLDITAPAYENSYIDTIFTRLSTNNIQPNDADYTLLTELLNIYGPPPQTHALKRYMYLVIQYIRQRNVNQVSALMTALHPRTVSSLPPHLMSMMLATQDERLLNTVAFRYTESLYYKTKLEELNRDSMLDSYSQIHQIATETDQIALDEGYNEETSGISTEVMLYNLMEEKNLNMITNPVGGYSDLFIKNKAKVNIFNLPGLGETTDDSVQDPSTSEAVEGDEYQTEASENFDNDNDYEQEHVDQDHYNNYESSEQTHEVDAVDSMQSESYTESNAHSNLTDEAVAVDDAVHQDEEELDFEAIKLSDPTLSPTHNDLYQLYHRRLTPYNLMDDPEALNNSIWKDIGAWVNKTRFVDTMNEMHETNPHELSSHSSLFTRDISLNRLLIRSSDSLTSISQDMRYIMQPIPPVTRYNNSEVYMNLSLLVGYAAKSKTLAPMHFISQLPLQYTAHARRWIDFAFPNDILFKLFDSKSQNYLDQSSKPIDIPISKELTLAELSRSVEDAKTNKDKMRKTYGARISAYIFQLTQRDNTMFNHILTSLTHDNPFSVYQFIKYVRNTAPIYLQSSLTKVTNLISSRYGLNEHLQTLSIKATEQEYLEYNSVQSPEDHMTLASNAISEGNDSKASYHLIYCFMKPFMIHYQYDENDPSLRKRTESMFRDYHQDLLKIQTAENINTTIESIINDTTMNDITKVNAILKYAIKIASEREAVMAAVNEFQRNKYCENNRTVSDLEARKRLIPYRRSHRGLLNNTTEDSIDKIPFLPCGAFYNMLIHLLLRSDRYKDALIVLRMLLNNQMMNPQDLGRAQSLTTIFKYICYRMQDVELAMKIWSEIATKYPHLMSAETITQPIIMAMAQNRFQLARKIYLLAVSKSITFPSNTLTIFEKLNNFKPLSFEEVTDWVESTKLIYSYSTHIPGYTRPIDLPSPVKRLMMIQYITDYSKRDAALQNDRNSNHLINFTSRPKKRF